MWRENYGFFAGLMMTACVFFGSPDYSIIQWLWKNKVILFA